MAAFQDDKKKPATNASVSAAEAQAENSKEILISPEKPKITLASILKQATNLK